MLCSDPDTAVEPHSEDYSIPYRYEPPAMYWLCRHCHRDKLHKRFARPELWDAFLAHVRRGGYARDLIVDAEVRSEFARFRAARAQGESVELRQLRSRSVTDAWWDRLSKDPNSLKDPRARPR